MYYGVAAQAADEIRTLVLWKHGTRRRLARTKFSHSKVQLECVQFCLCPHLKEQLKGPSSSRDFVRKRIRHSETAEKEQKKTTTEQREQQSKGKKKHINLLPALEVAFSIHLLCCKRENAYAVNSSIMCVRRCGIEEGRTFLLPGASLLLVLFFIFRLCFLILLRECAPRVLAANYTHAIRRVNTERAKL